MPSSGVQTCALDRKSTRLNSSHTIISYAVFCLKKKGRGARRQYQPRSITPPAALDPSGASAAGRSLGGRLTMSRTGGPDTVVSMFFFYNDRAPRNPPPPPPRTPPHA